jgi:hypothetical protein
MGVMGLLDRVKRFVGGARKQADDLAERHGDSIKSGIDKAADVAEKKLGKRKAKQVDSIAGKAKGVVDDLARPDGDDSKPAAERP